MERIDFEKVHKLLGNQEEMIRTRDEIIEIIRRENIGLVEENKMLMNKVLELQQEKATQSLPSTS